MSAKSEVRRPVIALAAPSRDAYSETFIQAHVELLKGNVRLMYGGFLPTRSADGWLEKRTGRWLLHKCRSLCTGEEGEVEVGLVMDYVKRIGADVLYAEYAQTGAMLSKVCVRNGLPLIVHVHGSDITSRKTLSDYAERYRHMFQVASRICAVSRAIGQKLLDAGAPPEKIVCVPNAAYDEYFDVRPAYESMRFLSVGRFVDKKAPYLTILTFKSVLEKYPDARLSMVGDGYLLNTCRSLVRVLGMEEHVTFCGVLGRAEICKLMSNSAAFVMHAVTACDGNMEGMPVSLLEASAAALPVIATRHSGIPEVVTDEETGLLVAEYDIDGMAQAMTRVISDPALGRRLGAAGRERVRRCFSMRRHIDAIDRVIHDALSESSSR